MRPLGLYWRGPLNSCTYACPYCPFAKRGATLATLRAEEAALARFVAWAEVAPRPVEILFTPYGEALHWPWMQAALVTLSRAAPVRRVGIQTNLSGDLTFVDRADPSRLSLWISFHPGEARLADFVPRVRRVVEQGVRCAVGVVGLPAHLEAAEALRAALPPGVRFWVNAPRPAVRQPAGHRDRWLALDPLSIHEWRPHATRGRPCDAGEQSLFIDGDGTARRCHFVDTPLGNLYQDPLDTLLAARTCPRARCDCWIGYAHLPALALPEPMFR